jgi:predicted SnoaL-like aldol condensation-catalyzing enzyme
MMQADLERNKAVVLDFYDRFFNKGDADALDQLLVENYIQHNPGAPDGRDAIKPFVAQGPFPAEVKRVIAEGDPGGCPCLLPNLEHGSGGHLPSARWVDC